MKNLKKLVAVLMTVAMMLTMISVPALAEETADALKLETLGVLKGTGNGVDAAYRASVPTRYQAAWLFLRLLGKEAAAKTWEGTLNFADVDAAKDAKGNTLNAENKKMLGYLYSHQALGFKGYADDTFRPFVEVNAQMYYKLMLTALGYVEGTDFTWDTVFAKAIEAGLIAAAPAADAAFNIDSLAAASVQALKATVKGGTKSLMAKLVEDDQAVAAAAATAAGLYVAPVVALAVTGVTASNMGEVIVTFNKAVKAADLTNNILIDEVPGVVTLSEDGKVATVEVMVVKDNGSTYEVVVKKAAGLEADYKASVTIFDTAKPEIVSLKLTAANTIVATFSEYLNWLVPGTVKINSGIIGVAGAVIDINNSKNVIITLASASLPAATYNIEFSGFTDFAWFTMDKKTVEFTYAPDTTKPTAELVSNTQGEVVIKFSEPVTLNATLTNYYHTLSTYTVLEAPSLVAGTDSTYRFVVATSPTTGNPIMFATKFYIKADAAVDAWGNKMGAAEFQLTYSPDTTRPSVVNVEQKDATVVVTFDENVDEASAETVGNYEFKLGTTTKAVASATYDEAKYAVTLTFATPLEGGRWTVVVKNVKDRALIGNVVNDNTKLLNVSDSTPIDTTKVKATIVIGEAGGNDIIYLTYPEAMNDTVLNSGYYMLKTGGTTALLSAKTVKIEANGTNAYKITRAHDDTLIPGTSILVVGRVQDAAGNQPAAFSFDVLLAPETAPAVESIAQTAANKLAVTFNKEIATYSLDAFSFWVSGAVYHTPALFDSAVTANGKTTLTFTLTADLITAIKAVSADYETNTAEVIGKGDLAGIKLNLIADKIVSASGMKNEGAAIQGLNADKRAPKFSSIAGFVLKFSEPISVANAAYIANDLVVKKGTETLIPGVDYSTSVNAQGQVVIDAPNGASTVESGTINVLKDAAGNKAEAFTTQKLPISFVSPTLSGKIHDNGADVGNVYAMPAVGTGDFTIEYDVTFLTGLTEGYIGFMSAQNMQYFTPSLAYYLPCNSIIFYFEGGAVKLINSTDGGPDDGGSTTWNNVTVPITMDTVHHVKINVHLAEGEYGTYDLWYDDVNYGMGMGFRAHGGLYDTQTRRMVTQPTDLTGINITDANGGGKMKVENLTVVPTP